MKYFTKLAVLGIPDRDLRSEIPEMSGQVEFAVQRHHANRAGKHYDLRLEGPKGKAFSWAIRHWPKKGEKRLAIRQPDHTREYMDFTGQIPEGYGAGDVEMKFRNKANILKSGPDKINFVSKKTPYTMIRTDGDKWLIINRDKVLDNIKK